MSTADTALSISINMAPGPEHRQEPVAPDKIAEGDRADVDAENVDASTTTTGSSDNSNDSVAPVALAEQSSNVEIAPTTFAPGADSANQSSPSNSGVDSKQQEEPATLSELNDSELRALLDEAITYKCPKDREGKSHLFKELLQEAEADETEEGHRVICNSRCLPGSNRRRHKRDSVSERLTHGGSLQNLAHPIASEFDSSFAYPTSSSCHTYGNSRKKNKKYIGPSVSARQREGGSLPSDVDASHSLASLANLDLSFDKKKSFCVERSAYDWTNKEKSKSLDKPSYTSTKKEEKEKEKKELKRDTASSGEIELETREKRVGKGKYGTNEMLESDNPPPEYKSDYMVIDLGDVEVGAISERNVGSIASGIQRPRSLDTENDEGTEMRIIEPRKPIHYVTRATLDVDSPIEFPIRDHKQEKSKMSVNGADVTGTLFQSHNSVKCGISGASNSSSTSQSKIVPSLCSVMPSWQAQNITMEGPRYSSQHLSLKDPSVSGEKKSLDENGNAVQSYNDRFAKKLRRKHTQEHNVKVYNAENVEGHRNEDIDSLINFIENKESKSKKGKSSNPVRVKASSGTKPRTREKDTKREQLPSKLQKSNSLEEISKTKLEDLTTEKSVSSSGASSVSSQHGENVALRRPKQRSTGDATVDSRGDRRSWGTEEGQSIYCNDTGEDYTSRRNSNKKINPESEHETEFLVVTKKKKSKKQRRSSSGSRAQNMTTSGSYLQSSRGFSNEYRTPLSPELRRKSASSMPPSDKSDSSDLDSVHSLPVTSNSSKHNLTKVATSSGGTPQASYADIARMATINISHMSTIVPGMLNTASWPSVPSKTSSEPDKVPQDYYPSLDEIQHSERKVRQQQNSAQSNHAAVSLSLAFEKSLSPTLTKVKNSSDRKKAEAQEEAINKNIQVFKYVQDIEKMQESLTQQEQKHHAASNSYSTNTSETIATNIVTPRLNNSTTMNYNPLDADNNPNCTVNNKDSVTHSRINNPRSRRSYVHSNQNVQMQGSYEEQYVKKVASSYHDEPIKKSYSTDTPQSENKSNPTVTSHNDGAQDVQKLKPAKLTQESQDVESELSNNKSKMTSNEPRTARVVKEYPNNNITIKHDVAKVGISQNSKQDQVREDTENKRTKSQSDKDQSSARSSSMVEMQQTKNSTPRPAVILLDETTSDVAKNNNLPTELTFGFEINEQLLLSEDNGNEETQATATSSPAFSSAIPSLVNKSSLNTFERNPPPLFNEKPARYDKFSSNYHMQSPNAHVTPVHPVMVQPLPYMGYPNTRFPPPTYLPPPPPPPPGIMEKFHPPKEDFAMLYVAPEEELNVQTYNHDKIVSFVGLAWDAVMRENVTATGRIQFYSGQ